MALVAIGIIMVFSASYYDALYKHKDVFYFLGKELTWAPIGIVAMIVMMLVDYHVWKKFTVLGYGITIVALVAVLLFGENINGATRWLNIAGISFQPSERSQSKSRRYFMALPESDLEDGDMLYGQHRDTAQFELEFYILCRIIGGFTWNPETMGKWFWQSEKDKDLVILRKWVEPGSNQLLTNSQ